MTLNLHVHALTSVQCDVHAGAYTVLSRVLCIDYKQFSIICRRPAAVHRPVHW